MTATSAPISCIVLAAGKGTRMHSPLPKVLHELAGRSMLGHVLATARGLHPLQLVTVVGPGMKNVQAEAEAFGSATAVQKQQSGTGDAVKSALPALQSREGTALILYGDSPFMTLETLKSLIRQRESAGAAVAVLGFTPLDPGKYGRLVVEGGRLIRIVEYNDASEQEHAIGTCNAGVMAIDAGRLDTLLGAITNSNARGEFYLTDIVGIANDKGWDCVTAMAAEEELRGVNSQGELAEAEAAMQQRLRATAMEGGVTLIDPASTYFSYDTQIAGGTTVEPHVWFGPGVQVDGGVRIKAFSHLEGVSIGQGAVVGPFARLRPGTEIGESARIGNFVEIKKSKIGAGAKVNHLSYIGDAELGAHANIGAGTVTCNYDGYNKHHTHIGIGAFIGSNTALVAPVSVGDGAIIAAGSTLTENVEADALGLARARQTVKAGWAKRFRDTFRKN